MMKMHTSIDSCPSLMRRASAVLVIIACLLPALSCSSSGQSDTMLIVQHEPILLVPDINAGSAGWCVIEPSGGVCPMGPAREPIIVQSWSKSSLPPVAEGYALTTNQVAAVSVDGEPPVSTYHEPGLPDGLRAIAVEIRGFPSQPHSGSLRLRFRFTPLNAKGTPIPERITQGSPLSVLGEPIRSLSDPAHPTSGVCRINTEPLTRLATQGGSVTTRIKSYTGLTGQGFLSCASTSYHLEGWSLLAGVLLSASHPGATPQLLPDMRPLLGHPGVFQAPGFEGEIDARRIPGAWLVVTRAKLKQRLVLLEHLRATVHL
jgi:hypothetical protein